MKRKNIVDVLVNGFCYKPEGGCFGYATSIFVNGILFDTGGYGVRKEIKKRIHKINKVVISHLHFDHCSNLDLFINTNIPIYISKNELLYYEKNKNIDSDLFSYFDLIQNQLNVIPVDNEFYIKDGVKVIFTFGHTLGHISLEVDGNTLLAGDAIKSYQDYLDANNSGNACDKEMYIQTKKKLKHKYYFIYPGHDFLIENGKKTKKMELIEF